MPSKRNELKNAIIVGNIQEVFQNKAIRQKATFRYDENGNMFYICGNTTTQAKEFEELFPIELKPIRTKGRNLDPTKIE